MITVQVTRKGITGKDGKAIAVGTELTHNGDTVPVPWVNKVRVIKTTEGKTIEVATPAVDAELDALRAEYAELFGSAPHHKMKPETIRQKIDEELAKTE